MLVAEPTCAIVQLSRRGGASIAGRCDQAQEIGSHLPHTNPSSLPCLNHQGCEFHTFHLGAMAKSKAVLMIVGDYVEDYEVGYAAMSSPVSHVAMWLWVSQDFGKGGNSGSSGGECGVCGCGSQCG
jgi:hypothetical protein